VNVRVQVRVQGRTAARGIARVAGRRDGRLDRLLRVRSIGFRLTVWYAVALVVALLVLTGALWLAVQQSLYGAIDESLRERVDGIGRFIQDHEQRLELDEVKEEFRAHGELFRVRDQDGRWVHEAEALRDVPLAPESSAALGATAPRFENVEAARVPMGVPLRVIVQNLSIGGRTYTIQAAASLGELREGLHRALWVLVPLFPIVLIAGAAGGYWLSRRALNPVDEITRTARSMTASNLSRRLPVPRSGDELERLSNTLNEMIARLESSFQRITHFTADASHELRTPLAVMRTTAEVALRNPEADEHREALEQILAELGHTTNLVDNLLLMANADSGEEKLHKTRVDVVEAMREAAAEAQVLAHVKGIALETRVAARSCGRDGPWVEADRHALRRLLLILLDNAVKYTPGGGRIEISVSEQVETLVREHAARRVAITVTDEGIGIAAEHQAHIFDRFYRVDRARSRSEGGAGLGLAIGRWIAEAHGGSLAVESEIGRGSRFTFELVAWPAEALDHVPDSASIDGDAARAEDADDGTDARAIRD
jgi:heavy metal sensor kinase